MNEPREHWLRRPETIRKLWIWCSALLAVLVLADFAVAPHPHFGIDGTFGFHAWYGFGACVAMVIGAKLLGFVLKRKDTYYDGD
jgi:hypothetical protein